MAVKTITADLKGGEALERHLKTITAKLGKGAAVKVGFFEGEKYSGEPYHFTKARLKQMSPEARAFAQFLQGKRRFAGPVAQVAFWNEFGTARTPPRPFMRQTVATKSPRWGNLLGAALRNSHYDVREALNQTGAVMAGQMRTTAENWNDPPNSKLTRELKGFNSPLRDTGLMAKSIDHEVVGLDDE